MITGRIHSIETLGLLDGPGIRTIFFLQGCPLRCKYCHNPDSQNPFMGKDYSVEELTKTALRYKNYYKKSGGGVTISGGEALLQGNFTSELARSLKDEDVHVTLDTSGYGSEKYFSKVLDNVDLVLLDVKQFENASHKDITGKSINGLIKFIEYLKKSGVKIWARHVMLPGYSDNNKSMNDLVKLLNPVINQVEKIEILPYHKLGVEKYSQLGIMYELESILEMDKKEANKFEVYANERLIEEKNYKARKMDIVI
ncbi:MAG: pyruvate formate-lyase-activating protein [Acidaminobacteraceae bacterium]